MIRKFTRIIQKISRFTYKIKEFYLPTTMNLKLWGLMLSKIGNVSLFAKNNSKQKYRVTEINKLERDIEILINQEVVFTFKDVLANENDMRTFSRFIEKSEYHYSNGKLIFFCFEQELIYKDGLAVNTSPFKLGINALGIEFDPVLID